MDESLKEEHSVPKGERILQEAKEEEVKKAAYAT
jgi:hypothetical protein